MNDSKTMNIAVIPGGRNRYRSYRSRSGRAEPGAEKSWEDFPFGSRKRRRGPRVTGDTGEAISKETLDVAAKGDAILLGACGLPDIRYPDGTEITPAGGASLHFRSLCRSPSESDSIRAFAPSSRIKRRNPSISSWSGNPRKVFSLRGGPGETPRSATETLVITRRATERLMRFQLRTHSKQEGQGVSR